MGTLAIELNDAGISAAGDGGSLEDPSPGYALLDGKQLQVGSRAQRQSRLKPRWANHRFWDQLGPEPMPKPFPRDLSRADVVHAHMSHLWDRIQDEMEPGSAPSVLLAVPGSFSTPQLGLILGVARACDIPVTGMVDAAVAAAATQPIGARILHLEATLHRMVWTELVHDGELARARVEVVDTGGLVSIWDAWAKHIAGLLIRQTRFDPFHHGTADQTLYDRLPGWLEQLTTSGSIVVSLESEGKEHSVEVTDNGRMEATEAVLGPVLELARSLAGTDPPAVLLVSHRAAGIPGLLPRLSQLPGPGAVAVLEAGASVLGALEHASRIESTGNDLPFVVRLPVEMREPPPVAEPPPPSPMAPPTPRMRTPTHLLINGRAFPLAAEPIWLGSAVSTAAGGLDLGGPMPGLSRRHCAVSLQDGMAIVEDHSSFGTYLNGRQVAGTAELAIGDRLRLGSPGVELLLIEVERDDV